MEFQENLFSALDNELKKVPNLTWLPWIGKYYDKTKTVVLGESQYEDGDEWQDGNINATRTLIEKRFSGSRGKLYTNVEKVLLARDNPRMEDGNYLWKSVAYWNLVQRLMTSIKERPNDIDFDKGWNTFFCLVEIIKPTTCIVLGKSSCGRLGYYLNNYETTWKRNIHEFYNREKIINLSNSGQELKLIFINHPSGSRGFNYQYWAKLINDNEPDLKQKLITP